MHLTRCRAVQLFENAIYLFSVQPFDPSDAIVIGGTRYTVSRITLLSVELTRGDGALITVTTTAMREMQVHNMTRSGKLQEELQFSVDRTTPHDKLKGVAHYVQACIRDHPKLYNGTYTIWWSASSGDKLQLSVAFDHKTNGPPFPLKHALSLCLPAAPVLVIEQHVGGGPQTVLRAWNKYRPCACGACMLTGLATVQGWTCCRRRSPRHICTTPWRRRAPSSVSSAAPRSICLSLTRQSRHRGRRARQKGACQAVRRGQMS